MQRNLSNFVANLDRLAADIYPQPPDSGHMAWGLAAIDWGLAMIGPDKPVAVLDVGCGQGSFAIPFTQRGVHWVGITVGEDASVARFSGLPAHEADMTFMPFSDKAADMIFARHTLEHSPFPLLTLMEWRRIARRWMLLVLPTPEYWGVRGRNHYSVLPRDNWLWLFERSGWKVAFEGGLTTVDPLFLEHFSGITPEAKGVEYWFLCQPAEEVVE